MSKRERKTFRWVAAAGVLFLIAAAVFLSVPYLKAIKSAKALPGITDSLSEMLPETKENTIPSSLPSMPITVYEKTDYIALIEFPADGVRLPVRAEYRESDALKCPFRAYGSAYSADLVIGGIGVKGQFGFFDQTDIGDTVYLTDMRGRRFPYEIMAVKRTDTLDTDSYKERGAELVLYSCKPYSSRYLVLMCRRKTGTAS